MRHDGSSLGVTLGRLQRPLGQWPAVVGMNDIVSGRRMIRQLLEDALQHLPGLPLPGVGCVQGIGCREQGQRIEQRSLSVVRIAAAHPVDGARIGSQPRAMVELVIVAEEGQGGGDEVGLALGLVGHRNRPDAATQGRHRAHPGGPAPTTGSNGSWRSPSAPLRKSGSRSAIARNSLAAWAYQNECSAASASLNACCAPAEQETGKFTPLPLPVACAGAAQTLAASSASTPRTIR